MEDDLDCSASSLLAEYNMWKDQFKTKSTDLPDNALDALNMRDSQFEANINTALKAGWPTHNIRHSRSCLRSRTSNESICNITAKWTARFPY
uniref:Uncharacterized protein n=1 Tax=Romanomermis culicivorax TaxID=13658 RepID=A0A915IV48_ROMCU